MITFELEFDEKRINRILDQVEVEFQRAIYEGGLKDVGKLLKKRVEQQTPRSTATGTRRKWSNKTRASRASVKPLADSIGFKVIKPKDNRTSSVLVGPKRPDGNIANLVSPGKKKTREVVLWGRRTGRQVQKDNDFVRRAVDESRSQIGRVFAKGTIRAVRKKLRDLGRG